MLKQTKGHASDWIVIATGWGLAVFCAVAVAGEASGAHINPAVTLGLALRGSFPWPEVAPHVAMQMLGALIGTTLAFLAYVPHYARTQDAGAKLATFATSPAVRAPAWNALMEAIGTLVLILVILFFAGATVEVEASHTQRRSGQDSTTHVCAMSGKCKHPRPPSSRSSPS